MSDPTNPDPGPPTRRARGPGRAIAYHALDGKSPGVVFLGGMRSDMTGTKARALEAMCRRRNRAFLRFDYAGHGRSDGRFENGTIGAWAEDAIWALDTLTRGPQVLVGSSMGGWIMLLVARARPARVAGLLGIAAAPDFTEDLMWAHFDDAIRRAILEHGVYHEPSAYDEAPTPITRALIEDGRQHLVLRTPFAFAGPVHLIHGLDDTDVPWEISLRLARHVDAADVALTLVKGGDHRLSAPADLARLEATLDAVLARAAPQPE